MRRDNRYSSMVRIRVIGVGGGGCNAINRMVEAGIRGVEFLALNTDSQSLAQCQAANRMCLGRSFSRGLGAGGDPNVGRRAALEAVETLREALRDTDMAFVTAGMGGGTGTGAAPVVAQLARELGILTVAIVTLPFSFEGERRQRHAQDGLDDLKGSAATLIALPNDRLLEIIPNVGGIEDAFKAADNVLHESVRGIVEFVTVPGYINLDFADVKAIMGLGGATLIARGEAAGPDRARLAAERAISSPYLDTTIHGARGLLVNFAAGPDLATAELEEAARLLRDAAVPNANIMIGNVVDESMGDNLRITVLATGFDSEPYASHTDRRQTTTGWSDRPGSPEVEEAPRLRFSTLSFDLPAYLTA